MQNKSLMSSFLKAHPKLISALVAYLFLSILSLSSWVLGVFIVNHIKKTAQEQVIDQQKEVLSEIKKESNNSAFPDFNTIKGDNPDTKIHVERITKDCPNEGCVNDHSAIVEFDGIKRRYKATGKFSRAYLYAELLVDYNRQLTNWDDLYFTMNNQGGHILSEQSSLPTPNGDTSKYLYDLRSISYYPTIRDKERKINLKSNINFFYFLENQSSFDLWVSISSNRPGRVMKEVSIYYECLEGFDCEIK